MGLFGKKSKEGTPDAKQQKKANKAIFTSIMKDKGVSSILSFKLIEDTSSSIPISSATDIYLLKDNSLLLSHTKLGAMLPDQDTAIYNFIDVEWVEDIQSKGKKVVGRSIAGLMIAGQAGMIIGGLTAKEKTKDKSIAVVTIQDQITHEIKMLSFACTTQEISKYKTIPKSGVIEDESFVIEVEGTPAVDSLDQLKKLKELLDLDVITQGEFDTKKAQLLAI